MNRRDFLKRSALAIASISGAAEFVSSAEAAEDQIEAPVHAVLVGGPEDGATVICSSAWIYVPVCARGRDSFGCAKYRRELRVGVDGRVVYRYDKTIW